MEQSVPKRRQKIQKPGYHPEERIQNSDTEKVVNQAFVMFPNKHGLKQEMFYRQCSSTLL